MNTIIKEIDTMNTYEKMEQAIKVANYMVNNDVVAWKVIVGTYLDRYDEADKDMLKTFIGSYESIRNNNYTECIDADDIKVVIDVANRMIDDDRLTLWLIEETYRKRNEELAYEIEQLKLHNN